MKLVSRKYGIFLVLAFGVLGVILLMRSYAASVSKSFEAEAGQHAGTTAVCKLSSASSDNYVKLAQSCGTTNPTPTPGGGDFAVYLGYADGNQMGRPQLPNPWKGDPNVIFHGKEGQECCVAEGTTPGWDGGTIRVQNNSSSPMTVRVEITEMDFCNRDWPQVTLQPGFNAIFVGDLGADAGGQGNPAVFDTSDADWSCRSMAGTDNCDPILGKVNVTINGTVHSYKDSTGIMSALQSVNGADSTCRKNAPEEGIEFTEWTKVLYDSPSSLNAIG